MSGRLADVPLTELEKIIVAAILNLGGAPVIADHQSLGYFRIAAVRQRLTTALAGSALSAKGRELAASALARMA